MFVEKNYVTEKIKKVKKIKNCKKLGKNKKIMKNLEKTEKNRKKPKMAGFGKKGKNPENWWPSTFLRIADKLKPRFNLPAISAYIRVFEVQKVPILGQKRVGLEIGKSRFSGYF